MSVPYSNLFNPSLSYLRRKAATACKARGHRMRWRTTKRWHEKEVSDTSLVDGICVKCRADVQCNNKPQPNEIDIGGTAVALNCPISIVEVNSRDRRPLTIKQWLEGYYTNLNGEIKKL